jgi:hypothetical protein
MKAELRITKYDNGNIEVQKMGTESEIACMLVTAMKDDLETCVIVFAAIPSLLDVKNISRRSYCDQVLNAKGQNK